MLSLTVNPSTLLIKPFWQAATWFGLRRLTGYLHDNVESYGDTICHFETAQPVVALTIDDGLCRGDNPEADSLAKEVLECLERHGAKATFFVCTEYLKGQGADVARLLEQGHELGNHLEEDKAFYYNQLEEDEFRTVLLKCDAILEELDGNRDHRWFRAPQGILTQAMAKVVREQNDNKENGTPMTHALGDSYCDDWRFARDVEGSEVAERRQHMQQAADLMLSQVQPGSICVMHMPQKGFRQGTLDSLELFLQGIKDRGMKCVTLTQMQQMVQAEASSKEEGGGEEVQGQAQAAEERESSQQNDN